MIVTVAGTADNSGITTLALEIARTAAAMMNLKTRAVQASSVLLVEADPAGGVLSDLLPRVETHHHSSLQKLTMFAANGYDQWPSYAWEHPNTHGKLRCLFSDRHSARTARSLINEEKELARYLKSRADIITIVDAGRVLNRRELVSEADTAIWVVASAHPGGVQRTKDVLGEYGALLAGEERFAVLTGNAPAMAGRIEQAIGVRVVAHLPNPLQIVGRTPGTRYRRAVEKVTAAALGVAPKPAPAVKTKTKGG